MADELDLPGYIGESGADGSAILALEILFNRVQARFVSDGTDAQFKFGWREPYRQLARPNRLIWVPGDESGSLGEFGPPTYPGRVPQRALAGLLERFTIWILAADVATPGSNEDELKQYRVARLLLDALIRAMALSFTFGSNLKITGAKWITEKNERRFGAGIQLSGAILAVIPDQVVTLAPIDTAALISSTELDRTDPTVRVDPS